MYTFDLADADISKGSKAANLGSMIRSGLPVPPGFVIAGDAFEKFIRENNLEKNFQESQIDALFSNAQIPAIVKTDIIASYEKLSFGNDLRDITGKALDIIRTGRDNVFVSVRPSEGRSYLGIVGSERLLNVIKKIWTNLCIIDATEKSIIIQRMVNAEKSGSIFTRHPIAGEDILIEACWGFGQILSSGVSADIYSVDRYSGNVVGKKIAKKLMMLSKDDLGNIVKRKVADNLIDSEVISVAEVKKLLEILPRFGENKQISWCMERGKIFILGGKEISFAEKTFESVNGIEIASGIGISAGIVKGFVSTNQEAGKIIVAKGFDQSMVPYVRKASGLLSEIGCFSSDASFAARECGIPYVLVPDINNFREGQEIILDGLSGKVYIERVEISKEPVLPGADSGNIITATEITAIVTSNTDTSVDSCLIKPENLFLEKNKHPIYLAKTNPDEMIDLLVEFIGGIAKSFYPKYVWYRSLDFRTDEFQSLDLDEDPKEENPILGWHGIRRSLDEVEVLKCETEAIRKLHSKGMNNIGFLLPFVVNPDEVESVKEMIDTKIGICVETPAAALSSDTFDVDYVSINCDTLTQLTLGVDKGNPNVSHLYSESHPSVLKLIKNVTDSCNCHVSISGNNFEPGFIEKVISFGIDSIATDSEKTEKLKLVVARSERKLLLEKLKQ